MNAASEIHGAQIPSPRWWWPIRDLPLIILAILSVAAAVVGWVTQYSQDTAGAQPAPVSPGAGAPQPPEGIAAACRAPIDAREAEPWIDGDGSAHQVWSDNAEHLADEVVRGEDGWAFYNDQIEENFSQSIGRRYLTVKEAQAWRDYFEPVATALEEQDIEFSIQITPSAASVYPDQLPDWTIPIQGSTPLDQFLVAAESLPVVDFRAALRSAADENAVYTPVNSHWTDWGGYVGWKTYAACHRAIYPDAGPIAVPAIEGVESKGIFNEYASYGVPDSPPEWTAPIFAGDLASVSVTDSTGATAVNAGEVVLDMSKLPASTTTDRAHSDSTAVILRDSMGNALSPYWAQEYAQTWQIQHRYDDWSSPPNYRSLVEQYNPDVVIVQMAERHLVNAPTGSSGY